MRTALLVVLVVLLDAYTDARPEVAASYFFIIGVVMAALQDLLEIAAKLKLVAK